MRPELKDLLELLNLEQIEVNVFRGVSPNEGWQRVYGGQVLGQALVAASRTVEDVSRAAHSLHGYFLRPGDTTIPIVYKVDRSHPVIQAVLVEAGPNRKAFESMLRIIEETVPIQQIWLDAVASPENTAAPFYGAQSSERRIVVSTAYDAVRRNLVLSHEETVQRLCSWEEFSDDEALAILASLKS